MNHSTIFISLSRTRPSETTLPEKSCPSPPIFRKPLSLLFQISYEFQRLRNSVGSVTSNALLATAPTAALVPPSLPPPCPTMRPIRSDRYRSPPYNLHRLMTSITLLHGRSDRSRPPRLFPPRPAYTRRDFAPDPSLAPPLPSFEFSQLFRPPPTIQSSPTLPVTNIRARASPRHEFSSGFWEEGFARVSRERERGSKNCGGRGKDGAAFGVL